MYYNLVISKFQDIIILSIYTFS